MGCDVCDQAATLEDEVRICQWNYNLTLSRLKTTADRRYWTQWWKIMDDAGGQLEDCTEEKIVGDGYAPPESRQHAS